MTNEEFQELSRKAFGPICKRLAEVENNPPAPLVPADYARIVAEGASAAVAHPPKRNGLLWTRPFGLNPYELFSAEYNAWNDGYEQGAAE